MIGLCDQHLKPSFSQRLLNLSVPDKNTLSRNELRLSVLIYLVGPVGFEPTTKGL